MNIRFKQVRNQEDGKGGGSGGTMNTGQTPVGDKVDDAKTAAASAETGQLKTGDPAAEIKT